MKIIVLLVSLLLSVAVTQVQAKSLADSIVTCSKQTDSLKRLVCYDNIAGKIEKQAKVTHKIKVPEPSKEPSPATSVMSTSTEKAPLAEVSSSDKQEETKSEAVSNFGMERKIAKEEVDDKIYAHISSIGENPYGKLLIELDNGHTWKQTDSKTIRLKVGQEVYLERGFWGSFFMSKDDVNRKIRVKRTK